MKDKVKLLWMSDSIHIPTGYGRVTKEILTRLNKDKFDIRHFGKQTFGQPHEVYGIMCYTVGTHKDGKDILGWHLSNIKPDILITLDDLWMHDWLNDMNISPTKLIQYAPMDGEPIPFGCHKHLIKADRNVAMSKFGRRVMEEAEYFQDGQWIQVADRLSKPIDYIPHGVSTNVFKPLKQEEIDEFKRQEKLDGKFIIGCISRNQPRKMMPRLFRAYKKFSDANKDAELYMHCDPRDPQGYNLAAIALTLKISHVRFTKMHSYKCGVSDEMLNKIYNIFDIHTIPTSGEGFGLTILEALSAGRPNIVTDYSTTDELVGDDERGIKVPCIDKLLGSKEVYRGIIDIDKYIDAMQYAYDNPNEMKKRGKKARKFALGYDWDKQIPKWEKLFKEVANG